MENRILEIRRTVDALADEVLKQIRSIYLYELERCASSLDLYKVVENTLDCYQPVDPTVFELYDDLVFGELLNRAKRDFINK